MININKRFDKVFYETKIIGLFYGFDKEETLEDLKEELTNK
jgi:hypothetical protein